MIEKHLVEHALSLAESTIGKILTSPMSKRPALHIVVGKMPLRGDLSVTYEECILAERSFFKGQWEPDAPYIDIAHSKGMITWSTGMDSDEIQVRNPQLLRPGDTKYWGSRVFPGFFVAGSGTQGYFDRGCCGILGETIISLCAHRREVLINSSPDADFFPKTYSAFYKMDLTYNSPAS
jgi:hypothetical protein